MQIHRKAASYFDPPDMHGTKEVGYSPISIYSSNYAFSITLFLSGSILCSLSTAVADANFGTPSTYLQKILY